MTEMSLLKYFKHREGLPDPRGSISSEISMEAIAASNKEVEEVIKKKEVHMLRK